MGNYTADKVFEIDFDGDKVSFKAKAPSIAIMKEMSPFINGGTLNKETGKKELSFAENLEIMSGLGGKLPELVFDLKGLYDVQGKPILLSVVCSDMYFLPLIQLLVKSVLSLGQPEEGDEKKLEGTSDIDLMEVQDGAVIPTALLEGNG